MMRRRGRATTRRKEHLTMDESTTQQSTGQDAGSTTAGRYAWLQDYESGNYDSLPQDEIYNNYRNWSQTANPDELYEATYYGYGRLPQEQWGSTAEELYNYCQLQGLDLSDVNLSSSDYQQWTAEDLARVTGRAYGYSATPLPERPSEQEQPQEKAGEKESKSGGGIPKPLIGLALAGALAFAASRVIG